MNFIDKHIVEKIYQKAREQEKDLLPDTFTAFYSRGSIVRYFVFFLISVIVTFLFGPFDKVALYITVTISIGWFFIVLYNISYRCFVDDAGIKVTKFWLFKKQILWKDIKKVEINEFEYDYNALEKRAIIRNKQDKIVFTCSYDLVGFNLIVKKAKKARKKKLYKSE